MYMVIHHCQICDYTTKFKSNLKRHQLVHSKPEKDMSIDETICVYCCKKFADKYKCKRHMIQNCAKSPHSHEAQNVCLYSPDHNPNSPNDNPNSPDHNPISPNDNSDSPDHTSDVVNDVNARVKCLRCYKTFTSTHNLQRHVENKKCRRIQHPFECEKCHLQLGSQPAKSRHQKICKGLTSTTLSVAPPCPPVVNKVHTNNGGIHNNCTTNNNQNNIIINNFGSENMSHISSEFIEKCLMNVRRGVFDYIERVNFNPDVPENHNIRYEDSRSVKIKEADNTWRLRTMQPTIEHLIKTRCRELGTHYDNNDMVQHIDTTMHFNIIRDSLQYIMSGVKNEIRPIYDNVVTLLRELENSMYGQSTPFNSYTRGNEHVDMYKLNEKK